MNKTKPSFYSFQSADPFLEELLARREADEKSAASYVPKPKAPIEQQPQPKPPGFARTTPPPSEAPKPAAPAAPAASSDSASSRWDLRRVATKDAYEAEQDAFSQREGQGFMVDPLSRKRSGERFRNAMAGIDAEQRIAERNERLRQRTRDMVAENKARREARTAGTQANAAGAPAAGPSNTARPQSTQTGASVKGSDTLYGTSPDGRKFLIEPGEQPSYLDGQPRPASVARRPQEPAAPFVYQDPRRFTNETPEGRLRNAGVLTPTGELNLEATDYGRQARLAEERARTDALYQKLLADDVARNPSNDPGLWDSSRRDPADPRGAGVPRSDPAALTQNMPSYEADRIAARNKKLNDLDSQHRLGYPHPDTSRAIGGRATATNAAGPIRGLDPGTPSDWPSIVPDEWPAAPAAPGVPSMLSPPDDRGTPPFLDRPGVPFLLEPNDSLPEYLSRRSSPIGSARRSLRQTPQRQLMDLADFTPPLRYGSR